MVWLILVMFTAQIFVPLAVTHAELEGSETSVDWNLSSAANVSENITVTSEEQGKNRITFVLGTDENLASLKNASLNATVDVNIYNATEAKSMDFSNESVMFLASLDNETVVSISKTINESTYVYAYNLTTTVSIGNVDDINITKYWVYGGDENIRNLIIYMDNKFYGNTTAVEPPKPPENRVKIAFVTSLVNPILYIKKAKDDLNISKYINVTTYLALYDVPASYQDINLSDQDVIMLVHLGYPVQDGLKKMVEDAKDNGARVIVHQFTDVLGLSNVNTSDPAYSNVTKYWDYGGEENMKRLIIFLGVKFCNINMEILPPMPVPLHGIYHPDAGVVFETTSEYLEWYNRTGKYNPSNITIGIHYYYTQSGANPVIDALIHSVEEKGANVIFATYTYKDPNSSKYFIQDNQSIVDAIITLTSFRLHHLKVEEGIRYLSNLDVTPLKGIGSYYSSPEEWENSIGLKPMEISWQIALPELDGLTEFIFVGGQIKDPVSGLMIYELVNYQIDWITDRAISWTKLRRIGNPEKKAVIIYYNHGGGKDNIGASYLDISPSLKNLLDAMNESGYEVGHRPIPNGTELINLLMHQGVNVGAWAPEELEKMISDYSLKFIPVGRYKEWFNELPERKRKEVMEKWGEPPGEIMVYENASGKYFVIPGIEFGNVFLAPQPTRGWLQNATVLYHSKELPPHHQYIAFYLWLKKEYGADAIIHLGTHGTQEWLPGKETALSVKDCWPTILIQDLPVIYPYVMDNVGEGTQAKRRGNAVIVDHLTPPIVAGGLYGNLSLLHVKTHIYTDLGTEQAIKNQTRETIIELYEDLDLYEVLGVSAEDLRAMNDTEFEAFINGELHEHLHELAKEFIPYGLHILGSPPSDWKLISFVRSMLGDIFVEHIAEIYPDPHALHHDDCTVVEDLLREVIFNNLSAEDAQKNVLGNISSNVTEDLNKAKRYATNISECTIEIPRTLKGLSGGYIPPKVGNDPIRNPDALPTGNNFYSFDQRLIPTKEAWNVGKKMGDSLLNQYKEEHGRYPRKVAFVLWATETMRHWGIAESQILHLMGVKPVWDGMGRVKDVELMNLSELGRPRIDVLIITSGLYRDTFPCKIKLLDKAVRLAAQAEEDENYNYVKRNSNAIYNWLIANGYSESEARNLSMARIFTESLGNYGTGLPNVIAASDTWNNETELAEYYIKRMGFIYGEDIWGVQNAELFRQNLADVEAAVLSRSSNLYGVLDNDDAFQYLGGLALAVRSITGKTPDLYITNLRDPHNPKTETLKSFMQREFYARYLNPKWLEGMMEHDYAGAREMMKFVEYLWGWDVVTPDLITQDMWNQVYDIYVRDKYNLGLSGFFESSNPYALQSITARMLEAIRKGYWNPSEDVKTALAEVYHKSVEKYGVTCCHHTCANLMLRDYMEGILSVPEELPQLPQPRAYFGGGVRRIEEETIGEGITNMTETTGVGEIGEKLERTPEKAAEKGKIMRKEKPAEKPSPPFPISGSPLMGIIAVIVILVLIGIGSGLKRRGT